MVFFSNNKKTRALRLPVTQILLLLGLALNAAPAFSKDNTGRNATVKQTTITQQKNKQTVLSFTFDKPVKYKVFTLSAPNRVVIDLEKTSGGIKLSGKKTALVSKLRHATRNTNDLRIVLDLKQAATPKASMKGKQLRIALHTGASQTASTKSATKKVSKQKKPLKKILKQKPAPKKTPTIVPTRPRPGDFIVAIDAGHGGKDPGASGARGTHEKDIVLQIAKRLKARIDRTRGMKGVLIRDGDYYVPLRKRMQIARKNHADLFVSIHADANPNRHLTGSSVYILSQNGASSEAARWLASSENTYESRLGNTTLNGKDNTLATMLMDLSQAATIDNSLTLAKNTLRELGNVTKLLHRQVESAAFVVLKSPDIPSMLVETAFISNPAEERRLKTAAYQNKLANAVFNGIKRFQVARAPGGKLMRSYARNKTSNSPRKKAKNRNQHVVKSGESLSVIARKYGVSQNTLSHHNKLSSSNIRIGQKLYIPTRS
ncbi:MAG: N-acetylmuramoyl-L-alanine amidase [Thiotrichaceae bacterium]